MRARRIATGVEGKVHKVAQNTPFTLYSGASGGWWVFMRLSPNQASHEGVKQRFGRGPETTIETD
jgi:hypothetical protein|eukprot:COSAG01_NODE_1708_length_9425_cov_5.499893_15_plen_65_part_00